jgi:HEAT repeat protein
VDAHYNRRPPAAIPLVGGASGETGYNAGMKLGARAFPTADPVQTMRTLGVEARPSALLAVAAAADDADVRQALLERLRAGEDRLRPAAAEALASQSAEPAVHAALLAALEDPYEVARAAAARALGPLLADPAHEPALRAVLEPLLGDPAAVARLAALETLAAVQTRKLPESSPLRALLDDPSSRLRRLAINVLAPHVEPEALRPRLADASTQVRCAAAAILRPADGSLWQRLAEDEDAVKRSAAFAQMPATLVRDDVIVRELFLRGLADHEDGIRSAALQAAAALTADDLEVRAAARAGLSDDHEGVRQQAVLALAPVVGKVLRDLVRVLNVDTMPVRLAALQVLLAAPLKGSIPTILDGQLPAALRLDGDESWPLAEQVKPKLVRAGLGTFAAQRLRRDDDFAEFLLDQLTSPNAAARIGAAYVLAAWPRRPPEIASYLLEFLDDRRDDANYPQRLTGAAQIVASYPQTEHLPEATALAIEALDYGLRPWDLLATAAVARRLAARILGALPVFDEKAFSRLLQVLHRDADPEVRGGAASALVSLARRRLDTAQGPTA